MTLSSGNGTNTSTMAVGLRYNELPRPTLCERMDLIQLQKWSYIAELPHHVDPVRKLLRGYSKIPGPEVDSHLLHMVPYPLTWNSCLVRRH